MTVSWGSTRGRLMQRWWDWRPNKPWRLECAVARVLCWRWGHEQGRSSFCDWCGKDLG